MQLPDPVGTNVLYVSHLMEEWLCIGVMIQR
jgi:hypothetical protein